jgi:eukaryotic-like serine/threonine-protein kinase
VTTFTPLDRTLGRYRLRYHLASGGMGSVYLAQATGAEGFSKWVALKVIHPHVSRDERFVNMFLDEARISARLNHPNICSVFDLGKADDVYFIAMEYLQGEALRVVIERALAGAHLPTAMVARVASDAARGLHAAHTLADETGRPLNIVHRDVSPQNVFVLYDGVTKVVDFGIASAHDRAVDTTTGEVKGKVAYMAPEQLGQGEIDHRTDVFALGIVLWETTILKRLFKRDTAFKSIAAVLYDPIPAPSSVRPDYPHALEQIVMKALERAPERRWQSMEELADALDEYVERAGAQAGQAQLGRWMKATFAADIAAREAMLRDETSLSDQGWLALDAPPSAAATAPFLAAWEASEATASQRAEPTAIQPAGPAVAPPARRTLGLAIAAAAVVVAALVAGFLGWFIGRHPEPAAASSAGAAASLDREPDSGRPAGPLRADAGAMRSPERADPGVAGDAGGARDGAPTALPAADGSPPSPAPAQAEGRQFGYVNIVSIPLAEALVGRQRLGITPLRKVRLPAGRHLVRLNALRTGESKTIAVEVEPGEVSFVSVRFESP